MENNLDYQLGKLAGMQQCMESLKASTEGISKNSNPGSLDYALGKEDGIREFLDLYIKLFKG